ncbi:Nif11-like leader peptide family natural product precursor [Pseudanabaena sp. PCC 6802]|uniref:Nif11-like leader peptide family natural product precursor n=1 Tax=Pseudanabaena sp. PCC 6802 TaxID=118173 RepID=UPI00034714B4|nr:Nif11-like leader peptide family natural product precursor [Pseudanabaena sp. PCC 6802]
MITTTTTQSTTNLEQFYLELLKDPMLQERLKAATDPDSLGELAVKLGEEKGYFFTKEEVLAAMAIEVAIGNEWIEALANDDEGEDVPITYTLSACY